MPKGTCWAKATFNSKIVKPVTLAVVKSCLPEGISQLLSQPVSRKIKLQTFCCDLMEAF